jgi:HPt (histidine-containing phosphotransfer) domain-containing protein
MPAPIDLTALSQMLGGDTSLVTMILEKFRAEIEGDISALADLANSSDAEAIRALAHRLKGTCSNAQAMPLSNVAKALQTATSGGGVSQAPDLIEKLEMERQLLERYLTEQGY